MLPHVSVARYLYGFEEYCRSAGITFRTVHHNDPRPVVSASEPQKSSVKQEPVDTREPSEPPAITDKPAAHDDDSENESEKAHKGTSPRVSEPYASMKRCVNTWESFHSILSI